MTGIRTYRPLINVVLLVVYAFIATPVQFWHHHSYPAKTTSYLQYANKAKVTASGTNNKTLEDNCQICAHHYSIYGNDEAPVFKISISSINSKQGFYALAIPLAPYFNSTNKGPPSAA